MLCRPDTTNKVQSAKARGEALEQVPSAMQSLRERRGQQQTQDQMSRLVPKNRLCAPACNQVVAKEGKERTSAIPESAPTPKKRGKGGKVSVTLGGFPTQV